MAAREDEAEPVVAHGSHLQGLGLVVGQGVGLLVAVLAGGLPADAIDGAVAGGGDEPAARVGRDAPLGPQPGGLDEGVLDRLLGAVDVAEEADQGGDDGPPLGAEDPREGGVRRACAVGVRPRGQSTSSWRGRTSTGPPWRASAALRAHSRAPSRSSHLMIQNPPRNSLVSA